jgi:hypothetical protein
MYPQQPAPIPLEELEHVRSPVVVSAIGSAPSWDRWKYVAMPFYSGIPGFCLSRRSFTDKEPFVGGMRCGRSCDNGTRQFSSSVVPGTGKSPEMARRIRSGSTRQPSERSGRDAGESARLQYLSDHPGAEKAFRDRTDGAGRGIIKIITPGGNMKEKEKHV